MTIVTLIWKFLTWMADVATLNSTKALSMDTNITRNFSKLHA